MSKENEAPSATEKGKGKMDDDKSLDTGKKLDDKKKDKDGKALGKGKKGEEPQEGLKHLRFSDGSLLNLYVIIEELNEEDQQLKSELEMLVTRLKV